MSFGHLAEGWRRFQAISNELDPLEQAGAKAATTAIGMPQLGRAYDAMPAWARTAGLIGSAAFGAGAFDLLTPGAAALGLGALGSIGGIAPRPRPTSAPRVRTQDVPRSATSEELGYGSLYP